jgi:AcrR family transcriptional regulator
MVVTETRGYSMGRRAAAAAQTREQILDVAADLLTARWYDDVTLADIARATDVSQQTVANHFGSKERLYLAALSERVGPSIGAERQAATVGDVDSIVTVAVGAYERWGPATVRMLALAERYPALAEAARLGRGAHRDWIEAKFAPQLEAVAPSDGEDLARRLSVILDVYSWHQLRHYEGRDASGTIRDLGLLVASGLGSAAGAIAIGGGAGDTPVS